MDRHHDFATGAPILPGSVTFEGGAAQTLLLNETGPTGLALDQAALIGGAWRPAGARLSSIGVASETESAYAIIALDGAPIGLASAQSGPQPGAQLRLSAHPAEAGGMAMPQTQPHSGVVCFATGTQIATPDGPRRVETLRPGMRVWTADYGSQPILWTGRREVLFKRHDNKYRPILVPAGAIRAGQPARDLIVSPDHRMLLTDPKITRKTGQSEVLAPAGALIGQRGIRPMHGKRRVTYVHIMLETHAILDSEGAYSESFLPDLSALSALSGAQRATLFDAAPELRQQPIDAANAAARPVLGMDDARRLLSDAAHPSPPHASPKMSAHG